MTMSTDDIQLDEPILTPEEIVKQQIEEIGKELREARDALKKFRAKALEAETRTINAKIEYERLLEVLRRINIAKVVEGESYALFDDEDNSG